MDNRPVTKLKDRSLVLCAEFQDGFAIGYAWALLESFKEALDIRFHEYHVYIYDSNGNHVKNLETNKKATRSVWGWTQGHGFNFCEGDMIHSNRLAYTNWKEFVANKESKTIQIINGRQATKDDDGEIVYRYYEAGLFVKVVNTSQTKFVKFLQTGMEPESA